MFYSYNGSKYQIDEEEEENNNSCYWVQQEIRIRRAEELSQAVVLLEAFINIMARGPNI